MGNCVTCKSKKSGAEIAPFEFVKPAVSVRLRGSPSSSATAYLRFALRFKSPSFQFVPAEEEDGGGVPELRIGSERASGTGEMMLRFIDARLPLPPLLPAPGRAAAERVMVVRAVVLQHRSVAWHLDRVVRWGEDLAARGGRGTVDPEMGTPRMEVRKFAKSYSTLLELMVEHAQMEERVVFPVLDLADRGICKAANEDHARNLPMMNGIKEDIKSIGVLDTGCLDYQEALSNLSTRLKSLQEQCKEQFEKEERDVMPLMEAVELSKEQQMGLMHQCFVVMQGTHSHLFSFFIEGLLPSEAMQYLDLILKCKDEHGAVSMLHRLIE
ncbi:hypothetical protein Tsubulata_030741 [Turnera subulata]|uniref:Hemerythrin-like domain-containing protein n=1 Tax=Turnera subulata TaxID=218843 RepID=A0A9Q0FSM5_9ROSI|nr:hypothetical protein Tsubulata_030741 [Turnera subulata]